MPSHAITYHHVPSHAITCITYHHICTTYHHVNHHMPSHAITCHRMPLLLPSHATVIAITCDYIRSHIITCHHMSSHAITCQHMPPHAIRFPNMPLLKHTTTKLASNFKQWWCKRIICTIPKYLNYLLIINYLVINYDLIIKFIIFSFTENFPLQTKHISPKNDRKPWITPGILISTRTKQRLERKARYRPDRFLTLYRRYRNLLSKLTQTTRLLLS